MRNKKYDTPFELISIEFEKANIPLLLIEGFAVNFYNVSRQTADIDFLVDQKDYKKVKERLTESGYKEINLDKIFARFSNQSDQLHLLDIDFMFVDKKTLKSMIDEGKEIIFAKNKFTVPSLDHLFALKLHSVKHNPERQYKDLLDIINLTKRNDIDVNTNDFKELCLKFGTKEIYKKIMMML